MGPTASRPARNWADIHLITGPADRSWRASRPRLNPRFGDPSRRGLTATGPGAVVVTGTATRTSAAVVSCQGHESRSDARRLPAEPGNHAGLPEPPSRIPDITAKPSGGSHAICVSRQSWHSAATRTRPRLAVGSRWPASRGRAGRGLRELGAGETGNFDDAAGPDYIRAGPHICGSPRYIRGVICRCQDDAQDHEDQRRRGGHRCRGPYVVLVRPGYADEVEL